MKLFSKYLIFLLAGYFMITNTGRVNAADLKINNAQIDNQQINISIPPLPSNSPQNAPNPILLKGARPIFYPPSIQYQISSINFYDRPISTKQRNLYLSIALVFYFSGLLLIKQPKEFEINRIYLNDTSFIGPVEFYPAN